MALLRFVSDPIQNESNEAELPVLLHCPVDFSVESRYRLINFDYRNHRRLFCFDDSSTMRLPRLLTFTPVVENNKFSLVQNNHRNSKNFKCKCLKVNTKSKISCTSKGIQTVNYVNVSIQTDKVDCDFLCSALVYSDAKFLLEEVLKSAPSKPVHQGVTAREITVDACIQTRLSEMAEKSNNCGVIGVIPSKIYPHLKKKYAESKQQVIECLSNKKANMVLSSKRVDNAKAEKSCTHMNKELLSVVRSTENTVVHPEDQNKVAFDPFTDDGFHVESQISKFVCNANGEKSIFKTDLLFDKMKEIYTDIKAVKEMSCHLKSLSSSCKTASDNKVIYSDYQSACTFDEKSFFTCPCNTNSESKRLNDDKCNDIIISSSNSRSLTTVTKLSTNDDDEEWGESSCARFVRNKSESSSHSDNDEIDWNKVDELIMN